MAVLLCAGSGSSGNSYAIRTLKGETLLIECGVKWKKILKMIDFDSMSIVGCLVSHSHGDHIFEFETLLKNGIQIYTNDETADHFEIVTGEKMIGKAERITFECSSFSITPFYIPHTTKDKETKKIIKCPNYGYIISQEEIGSLIFMTDLEYCPYSFKSMHPEHLMIECNYMDSLVDREESNYLHRIQGHCSLNTCEGIIKANMTPFLRTVTLIHLSDMATDQDQIVNNVKNIVGDMVQVNIAHAGMEPIIINKYPF